MAWITLSAAEADDLRGLLGHAGEVLTVEVVGRLRRRFGDLAPAEPEQTRDALGRWAARLVERQACQPDRSVRLDAGEVDGLGWLLGNAHLWLDALERLPWPVDAAGLPGRLARVRDGLTALLEQAHAGPDSQVTTLGGPAGPGLQGSAAQGGGRPPV